MKFTPILVLLIALGLSACTTPKQNTAHQTTEVAVLSATEKVKQVEDLIHKMPKNGMKKVAILYPDLQMVKSLSKNDSENISDGMSAEEWQYSAKDDVTVVVCKMLNTPAHIFKGKSMTESELASAKKMMKDMMDMMGGDHDMDMDMMDSDHAMITEKYEEYSAEQMAELRGNKKFAIFFHADWCGTCKAWEAKTKENLASLPADTVILKANYDTETDLAKELHVKSQSTVIFFDSKGEIVNNVLDPSQEVLADFFANPDNDVMTATGAKYEPFDQAKFDTMKGSEKMMVFFHADWCGTCRAWEARLQENIDSLPENTRIFKANYDTDLELRKEYEITRQSLAAFIDTDGTTNKIEGDPSIETISAFFAQ